MTHISNRTSLPVVLTLLAIAVGLHSTGCQQSIQDTRIREIEAEVKDFYARVDLAVVNGDVQARMSFLDEAAEVTIDGRAFSREELRRFNLDNAKHRPSTSRLQWRTDDVDFLYVSEDRVRVKYSVKASDRLLGADGKMHEWSNRFDATDTLVRKSDGWKLVSSVGRSRDSLMDEKPNVGSP